MVASFALSEAEAGSDAAALQLRAEPDGDGWRLTGEKTWISNAPEADLYTVFARTTPDARARGITAFVVAGDAAGLTGEHLDMLAPHALGRLSFDGVRVGRPTCWARWTPASRSRCAPWTCCVPASVPSRWAWPRPRWRPRWPTPPGGRPSAARWQ